MNVKKRKLRKRKKKHVAGEMTTSRVNSKKKIPR